jgi:hypothetical protein
MAGAGVLLLAAGRVPVLRPDRHQALAAMTEGNRMRATVFALIFVMMLLALAVPRP